MREWESKWSTGLRIVGLLAMVVGGSMAPEVAQYLLAPEPVSGAAIESPVRSSSRIRLGWDPAKICAKEGNPAGGIGIAAPLESKLGRTHILGVDCPEMPAGVGAWVVDAEGILTHALVNCQPTENGGAECELAELVK